MDVDDAKIREEAKAILKEIMDPPPDPKKEQVDIWEAWFDRMAGGGQAPEIAGEAYGLSPPEAEPQGIPQRRKWFSFRFSLWR